MVVASPGNPTVIVLPPAELAAIAGWCSARGVRLIGDETYHGISYGTETACAEQSSRESIVLGSFSKYFAMTGWRLGCGGRHVRFSFAGAASVVTEGEKRLGEWLRRAASGGTLAYP